MFLSAFCGTTSSGVAEFALRRSSSSCGVATLRDGLATGVLCTDWVLVFFVGTVTSVGNGGKVGTTSSGNCGITTTGATSTGSTGSTGVDVFSSLFAVATFVEPAEATGSVTLGKVATVSFGSGGKVGTVSVGTTNDCVGTAITEAADPCEPTDGKVGTVSTGKVGKVGVGKVGVGKVGEVVLIWVIVVSKAYTLDPKPITRNILAIITFFITILFV